MQGSDLYDVYNSISRKIEYNTARIAEIALQRTEKDNFVERALSDKSDKYTILNNYTMQPTDEWKAGHPMTLEEQWNEYLNINRWDYWKLFPVRYK